MASDKTPDELRTERKKYHLEEFDGLMFVGKVRHISVVPGSGLWEGMNERKVTVIVEKYWLKAPKSTVVLYTGMGDADCGVRFEVGKTFLFRPSFSSGILRSWLCDYVFEGDTSPDGETAKEIEGALGPPKSFTKPRNQ